MHELLLPGMVCASSADAGKLFMFGDGRHGKLCHRQDQWFNMFVPHEVEMKGIVVKVQLCTYSVLKC